MFNERQKDYEAMSAKPLPPEVNFSEILKDEPISNMEELIQAQQKQREYDILIAQKDSLIQTNHPIIHIDKKNDVPIQAEELIDTEQKKRVTWSDESTDRIKSDIAEIKQQLVILFEAVSTIRDILIKPSEE
jgi:hypothetical protein